ncbi:Uncharacterised protein [BD1-7 clade bacterium]|uniref:TonB-dependent receptor-like beta-barrel domain-containing protein n=1 Tax=BD1-7 clade bacterium TaxID=2029982 RepID=A0A5S9QEY6_9GAMM|nr:Uncharacterised protein [BD1-7 clade bacterium]CAA0117024.1 Uncharacterised protein [BD1-7 clade bacterium]
MKSTQLTVYSLALSLGLLSIPSAAQESATSPAIKNVQDDNSSDKARNPGPAKPDYEEVIVEGRNLKVDITKQDVETEQLFNSAGAAFDPLQAVYSLPGVTFSSGFQAEPAIRGSAPVDNAYYIDFIPARYIFHLFGNSIFNKNLVHRFDLYPAAFPSRYTNATGGVIDVTLREPANVPFTTTITASFLLAGLLFESAITEDQAFYASYRRSLIEYIASKDLLSDDDNGIKADELPSSDDYQAKYRWDINDEHRINFVASGARDSIAATFNQNSNLVIRDPDFAGAARIRQGYDSQGIVWDWINSGQTQMVKTLFSHLTEMDNASFGTGQFNRVTSDRYRLQTNWEQALGENHWFTLGGYAENVQNAISINAKIPVCDDFDPDCDTVDAPLTTIKTNLDFYSVNLYAEDGWSVIEPVILRFGVNVNHDTYTGRTQFEPRGGLTWFIDDAWTYSFSAGQYSQLPLLEELVSEIGNPDLDYIKSNHFVTGIENQLDDGWSWKTEIYYKTISDLVIAVVDPDDPLFDKRYINQGSGDAWGAEVFVNKQLTDNWYGWIALSYSRTSRRNDRTGQSITFDYDKPLILNIVGNYIPAENWMIGFKWSAQSGALYTPIVDLRDSTSDPDVKVPIYGQFNSYRQPLYHRLDIRAEYKKPTSSGYWSLYLDLLNAYNQKNVDGYSYAPNGQDTDSKNPPGFASNVPVRTRYSIGLLPSIGFEIQF